MKGVILVTRYFVPYCNQVGWMIRMVSLANFLVDKGYRVTVIAFGNKVKYEKLLDLDERVQVEYILDAVSSDTRNRIGSFFFRAHRWFMKNFIEPHQMDSIYRFLPRYKKLIRKIVSKDTIGSIVISSPPCSLRLLGPWVKKRFPHIQTIADYRDPWTLRSIYINKYSSRKKKRIQKVEQRTLRSNDVTVFVSEGMRQQYKQAFHIGQSLIVQNGFLEHEDGILNEALVNVLKTAKKQYPIVIGYTGSGSLTGSGYKDFLNVIEILQTPPYAKYFKLLISGIIRNIESFSNIENVDYLGVLSNNQVRLFLEQVNVGLMVYSERQDAQVVMGGKIYDCIGARTPIWFVVPENADSIIDFMKRHGKGYFSNYFSPESIRDSLNAIIDDYENKRLQPNILPESERDEYRRINQYEKLLPFIK